MKMQADIRRRNYVRKTYIEYIRFYFLMKWKLVVEKKSSIFNGDRFYFSADQSYREAKAEYGR
jgi:hypothetical protein